MTADRVADTLTPMRGAGLSAQTEDDHGLRMPGRSRSPFGFLDHSQLRTARTRCHLVKTLKVGISTYAEMKARTLAVTRGEYRGADESRVWFTSTESFAKVLSAGNRELLRVIREEAPGSIEELAKLTGRAKSNLSRTLKAMAGYGLIQFERGERGRLAPKVTFDRVELDVPIVATPKRR